jgi:hypothetical protein
LIRNPPVVRLRFTVSPGCGRTGGIPKGNWQRMFAILRPASSSREFMADADDLVPRFKPIPPQWFLLLARCNGKVWITGKAGIVARAVGVRLAEPLTPL